MAPRRPKPKVDNCTYVQQLFKNFLNQNQSKKVPEVLPKSIARPVQRFPIGKNSDRDSLFRQGVKRNLLKVQNDAEQPNTVKEFFAQGANKPHPEVNPTVANQPVHARFKRHEGSDKFVKCQLSPNAPPRGLAQWLSFRKKTSNEQKMTEQQNKPNKKIGEYLELPGTFFSGREPMTLPFEAPKNGNKTLMSVGSTFIPPATSTPFDGNPIVCSPIILDPVELTRKKVINLLPANDSECFLQRVGTMLDQWCASISDSKSSPLDRNYCTLKEHWRLQSKNMPSETTEPTFPASLVERSSWKDHSMLSNQMHHQYRKQNHSPSLFSIVPRENTSVVNLNDTSAFIEVQLGCDRMSRPFPEHDTTYHSFQTLLPRSNKRKIVDSLLTASPPSPISNVKQILNEDISFGSPSKPKSSHETFQFEFDFTQPSHSFDDIFSFDEPRRNDSFCFFPPSPDIADHGSSNDTLFITLDPRENNKSSSKDSLFDLFP
ncbi:uncharacterized protein LOC135703970 [Ochlerotatus camptorhynchus]|uniref:uncharacterized protein LOC135703970 n=1 Tax=Ochlerotatus camptorhynchus TaxID=644619 RepID=UPI0031E12FAF